MSSKCNFINCMTWLTCDPSLLGHYMDIFIIQFDSLLFICSFLLVITTFLGCPNIMHLEFIMWHLCYHSPGACIRAYESLKARKKRKDSRGPQAVERSGELLSCLLLHLFNQVNDLVIQGIYIQYMMIQYTLDETDLWFSRVLWTIFVCVC